MITQCFSIISFAYTYHLLLHTYVLHIPLLVPFSAINNILISVNNSRFTPVFFKQACHANPGANKNEEYQVRMFQYIYF